jgi:hypothetical protein
MSTMESLSDDAREIKEVSALFGRAVFFIQAFERQLGITLASVCLSDPDAVTREQYDALLSRNFKKTLGQLFHKMKVTLTIPNEIKQEIEAALQLRNFLIHNYFWERMIQFNTSAGRQMMLEELYQACLVFQKVDSKVTAITMEWAAKRGVTEQDYAEELGKLLKIE